MKIFTMLFLIAFSATLLAQTTVNLVASRDNTIYERSNSVSNGAGVSIFAGKDNAGNRHRGLLSFDLSSIPANATITNVSLQMFVNKTRANISDVHKLQKVTTSWGEGTSSGTGGGDAATANDATWSDRFFGVSMWGSLGGDFSSTISSSVSINSLGTYTFPNTAQMIADVQGWLTTPANNFGWIIIGQEINVQTARAFDSRESLTVANRPTLIVTYTAAVPVEWLDFTGFAKAQNAHLAWSTASEANSSHFEIEVKMPKIGLYTEGDNFETVGTVKAAGTTPEKHNYTFTHPYSRLGVYQYRIKQVDFDGKIKYSKTISIANTSDKNTPLKVYPNPATDKLIIDSNSPIASMYMVDVTGHYVREVPAQSREINVSDLATGLYFIQIKSNEQTMTLKFFKK